ncbi:MAG: glutamate--tRNA ligase [Hyperthermus sp.]|nr:MAG: glutamate--tRNA ligase [Hyperthermus sp.]
MSGLPWESEVKKLAWGYALLNATEHGGKAAVGPVMGKIMAERSDLRPHAKAIAAIVRSIVNEVNKLTLEEQRRLLEEEYSWVLEHARRKRVEEKRLPPLPGAVEGRVVTRFAPNPDFVIHLGNARPALLSYEYKRIYKGKMILRFEDTDPRTKAPLPEAYELIREDLRWLGIEWDEEYVQSLRLQVYYDVARSLLEKGGAYIDTEPAQRFKEYRDNNMLEKYPPRSRSVEDNLEEWDRMLEGWYGEGEAVLRVKTDPRHRDPSVRDWVGFRIIDTGRHPHPIVGDKYTVWPTYNFAAAVDDHLMGVTHILRAREHQQNTVKQSFLYSHMGWEYPHVIHFGRLKLEGFIMSKSTLKNIMESGVGRGIDDPRFATLAGLRRRGIVAEAIRKIIVEDVGVKYTDASISFTNLAAVNRVIVDPAAKRLMAVFEPLTLQVKDVPWQENRLRIPFHPSGRLGEREVVLKASRGRLTLLLDRADKELLKEGRIVRLMEAFNIRIEKTKEDTIEAIYHSESLEEARRNKAPIIQWVSPSNALPIQLVKPEGLTLRIMHGFIEEAAAKLGVGDIVQLVRVGFARVDSIVEGSPKATIVAVYAHS